MPACKWSAVRCGRAMPGWPSPRTQWPLTLACPCTARSRRTVGHPCAAQPAMQHPKPGSMSSLAQAVTQLERVGPTSFDNAPGGHCMAHVRLQVGFRDVRVARRQLLVNGRPVMIKGVNRHEHDERRGKAITEARYVTRSAQPIQPLLSSKRLAYSCSMLSGPVLSLRLDFVPVREDGMQRVAPVCCRRAWSRTSG